MKPHPYGCKLGNTIVWQELIAVIVQVLAQFGTTGVFILYSFKHNKMLKYIFGLF